MGARDYRGTQRSVITPLPVCPEHSPAPRARRATGPAHRLFLAGLASWLGSGVCLRGGGEGARDEAATTHSCVVDANAASCCSNGKKEQSEPGLST